MGEILHGAACVETTTGDETTTVLKEVPPSEPVPEPEPEEKIVVAPAPDPVPEQVEERAPIELFADNAILDFGGAVLGALDAETAAALGLDVTSGMYILDWVGPRDRRLEGQVIQALDGNVVDSPRAYRSLLLEAHRGDTPSLMFFLADEGAGPFVSVPIVQAGLAAVKGLRDEEAAEMAINRSARRCDERAGSPFHPDLAVGRMSGNGVPPSKISEIGRQTVAICKAALTSFPDQPRMLFNLGRAYHGTGDTEAALDRSRGAALSNLKCTWIQRLPGRWLPLADRRAGGFRQVDFTIFVKNPPRETASVA
ncbi:hypothetical protein [Roseovarius sp.]|uniref:hypothetical protein n=1 Tax=Roseovarius sp. TaxID=1486281 RepID=UPI003563A911